MLFFLAPRSSFNSVFLGTFSLLSFWKSQSIFILCHREQRANFQRNLAPFFLYFFIYHFLFLKLCLWFLYWMHKWPHVLSHKQITWVCDYFCEIGVVFENVQEEFPFVFLSSTISLFLTHITLINICQKWMHLSKTWGPCYSDSGGAWRVGGLKFPVSNYLPGDTVVSIGRPHILEQSLRTVLQYFAGESWNLEAEWSTKCLSPV